MANPLPRVHLVRARHKRDLIAVCGRRFALGDVGTRIVPIGRAEEASCRTCLAAPAGLHAVEARNAAILAAAEAALHGWTLTWTDERNAVSADGWAVSCHRSGFVGHVSVRVEGPRGEAVPGAYPGERYVGFHWDWGPVAIGDLEEAVARMFRDVRRNPTLHATKPAWLIGRTA
jgi:hypothetical protein